MNEARQEIRGKGREHTSQQEQLSQLVQPEHLVQEHSPMLLMVFFKEPTWYLCLI
jgi:hypothetical protein